MNTTQLQCALESDPAMKEYQREVFALDQFKNAKLLNKGIYICNEQTSRKPGSHWFLVITESDKVYFIDSFAQSPKYYGVDKKLQKLKRPVAVLSDSIQNPFSTLCGEYCLFFAYHLSRNFNLKSVTNFFTNDYVRNDQNIKQFVWRMFPGHERDVTNIFWFLQNK